MGHLAIFAEPGRGKGTLIEDLCAGWIASCNMRLFGYDPHDDWAPRVHARCVAAGNDYRVIYETTADLDLVVGFDMTVPTNLAGEAGKAEQKLINEWWLQVPYALANMDDGKDNPWIKFFLEATAGVMHSLPEVRRIDEALKLFRRNHPEQVTMLQAARDTEASWAFFELLERSQGRDARNWAECLGAMRRLTPFGHPHFYLRDGGALDHELFLTHGPNAVIRNLKGVPREAQQALIITEVSKVIRTCQRHYERTGKPLPTRIVIDEAGAMGIIDAPLIRRFAQEARKWMHPGGFVIATQSPEDFRDRQAYQQFKGYFTEQMWGRLSSGQQEAMEELASRLHDPDRVVREEKRWVHSGSYQEIDGRIVGKYEEQPVEIRETKPYIVGKFLAWNSELKKGEWMRIDPEGYVRWQHELPAPAFPWGLEAVRVPKAIERMKRESGFFTRPKQWPTPHEHRPGPILDATGEPIGD